MTVLITGANGFIGSHIAHFFLKEGAGVIATSKQFHTSTRQLLDQARLVELDVLNTGQLQDLTVQADVLIHVATANDVVSKSSIKGIELSAIGTKNMLDFAVKNKIPKCIVFSTLQVYGTELAGDITEASPLHFQNDYGLNHLVAEMYAEQYHRQQKLKCAVVRPSNVYGDILSDSFNRWNLIPGCFCREAAEKGTITILSSGLQMRNFVHVKNLALAIKAVCTHNMDNFEAYNIAGTEHRTMLDVAELVKQAFKEELNAEVKINVGGTVPAETNFFRLSTEKLRRIGFVENEAYNLRTGIKAIINYLQNKKDEPHRSV